MEPEELPLRERKQRRAREAIVEAAFALFAEHGYDAVTVADIARRAEVGRTTFFRYFGDKTEVVFADERSQLERIAARAAELAPRAGEGVDLAAGVARVQVLVLELCDAVTEDAPGYRRHEELLLSTPELQDRGVRKRQGYVAAMTELLRHEGADDVVAELAPRLGLACYDAGRQAAGTDPRKLRRGVEEAFEALGYLSGASSRVSRSRAWPSGNSSSIGRSSSA